MRRRRAALALPALVGAALLCAGSARAVPVVFSMRLFDATGAATGSGGFTAEDGLLNVDGLIPITDLVIELDDPSTVFAIPVGSVEAIVDSSLPGRIRAFDDARLRVFGSGDEIVLSAVFVASPDGYAYHVEPGGFPTPHAGTTGRYAIRNQSLPEPAIPVLLLTGLLLAARRLSRGVPR